MPIRDAVLKGRGFKPLPLNAHSRRCFERARLQAAAAECPFATLF